jgi:hypothetical protein
MANLSIVEKLTAATVSSSSVPPIDPLIRLFASHISVQPNSTERSAIPLVVKMAIVALHDAMTGSHPAPLRTNAAPTAKLTVTIPAASHRERYRSARNDRIDEISELAAAAGFPSRMKWSA